MEPSTKKRKLAPKVASPADPQPQPTQPAHDTTSHYPILETPTPLAERHDFESFARHLQDAAMLIQRQADQVRYAHTSVLMLTWEGDDATPHPDREALEKLLNNTYHYHTQRWQIPCTSDPSAKLGAQIAPLLDSAKSDHLLMIYYAGHGFVSSDGQLYWANEREDSYKLKWDDVRCHFEHAEPDILLLMDTCAMANPNPSGSRGVKQVIASCVSDPGLRGFSSSRLTSNLLEAFRKLASASPFSTRRLLEELKTLYKQHSLPVSGVNGANVAPGPPVLFTITPGKVNDLTLAPLSPNPQNGAEADSQATAVPPEEQYIDPAALADIRFDEARILVCTTFVGDASPDMTFFHHWLQNTPSLGAKIAVEGLFLGPPTMLLISMPNSIWNVVQHDKVCCFLGYITSHNMLQLYQTLAGPAGPKPSAKQVEEGRILVEAREAVVGPMSQMRNRGHDGREASRLGSTSRDATALADGSTYPGQGTPTRGRSLLASSSVSDGKPRDETEGTEEMREAAEQLKALSHVRHRSDDASHTSMSRPRTSLPNGILNTDIASSRVPHDPSTDMTGSLPKPASPSRVKVPRHALPKNETRCNHCTHAPFRDSSSLRKHIAAAHTRPFPCAFSFAGCNSTFGSKNEWKRHIASQHLCLQYYRCSACPQTAAEGKGNEFNRKDLFTQHLRRMHAPYQVKRPGSADSKVQEEWEQQVKSMQETCLVTRRKPPQKCACAKPECQHVCEGPGAWDEWTEHVGRHMEKGEASNLGVDQYLVSWSLDENIIERTPDGGYRLSYNSTNTGQNASFSGESASFSEAKEPNPPSFTESSQAASSTQEGPSTIATTVDMDVDK